VPRRCCTEHVLVSRGRLHASLGTPGAG
jgi:hypothetical protein